MEVRDYIFISLVYIHVVYKLNSYPLLFTTCWLVIFFFQKSVQISDGWAGKFWGRTGCVFDINGHGHCDTGDCGKKMECNGAPGVSPFNQAEIRLNAIGKLDIYHVSVVDGFNIPVQVRECFWETHIAYRFYFTCVYSGFVKM
jgi:hypothetical protein